MQTVAMKKVRFHTPIQAFHRLKSAGFTEKQAEAQIELVSESIESNLVIKDEFTSEIRDMRSGIKDVRTELSQLAKDLKSEMRELRSELRMEMKELEFRLTVKTATIVGTIVGFFSIMEKFIK